MEYYIYTDGSCLDQGNRFDIKNANGLKGGWGYSIIDSNYKYIIHEYGCATDTTVTNNRMEILAIIKALRSAYSMDGDNVFTIYSDSKYCVECVNDYMQTWKDAGWKKKRGSIANLDLWKIIDKAKEHVKFNLVWVKAHDANEHNNFVDQLANGAAKSQTFERYSYGDNSVS